MNLIATSERVTTRMEGKTWYVAEEVGLEWLRIVRTTSGKEGYIKQSSLDRGTDKISVYLDSEDAPQQKPSNFCLMEQMAKIYKRVGKERFIWWDVRNLIESGQMHIPLNTHPIPMITREERVNWKYTFPNGRTKITRKWSFRFTDYGIQCLQREGLI